MAQPISPAGCKHCNNMSSCWFEPPSRSKFIYYFFQKEYKGLGTRNLITGTSKCLVPGFHTTCVKYNKRKTTKITMVN